MGRDRPVLGRDLARHHLEERVAVRGGHRVRVLPVQFVLGRAVLVVRGVRLPAERLHVPDELAQVVHRAGQALEVVARLLQRVEAGRVERGDRSVRCTCDEHVLGLDAHAQFVAGGGQALDLGGECRPRAVRPGLGVHLDVAREPGDTGFPRHHGVGVEVRHPDHVVAVRTLAHAHRRGSGESGAAADELVERGRRHALAARGPVDVHPLGEDVVDAVLGQLGLRLLRVHGLPPPSRAWRVRQGWGTLGCQCETAAAAFSPRGWLLANRSIENGAMTSGVLPVAINSAVRRPAAGAALNP